jgi:Glu-tRNA(Gln) amidotransferase subunit E-like FAD-binding protein
MEILDGAKDEPLRAFGLGYLSHLAADSVAHNYFVPKQLAVTSSTSGLGHSYWESRFETHLGTACARRARELIQYDHSRSDNLLDRVLSPTIFSTSTNRLVRDDVVSRTAAKQIFATMVRTGDSADAIATRDGLLKVSDDAALARWIDEALAEHPGEAQRYLGGERRLQGVLVGFVMKKSNGSADPKRVNQLLQLLATRAGA